MNSVGFPTQGEVLQFVFNALGVLPRKHESDESFEEVRKKTTQAALRRLAREDGLLQPNLQALLETLSYLTAGALPPHAFFAFGEAFFDIFETYRHALKTEGTFLGKADSVKYFLHGYCAPRLAISVAKQLQRFNVEADGMMVPPTKFWYLPTHDGRAWEWPLERVMRWAYQLAETSCAQFHCPEMDSLASELSKNLDNAKNWLKGEHLPSWTSLLRNFLDSFAAVNRTREKQKLPLLPKLLVSSVCSSLFLARAATAVAMEVVDHYGDEVLLEFCQRYRRIAESTVDATETVKRAVREYIEDKQLPVSKWDDAWFRVTSDYWQWFVEWQDKLRFATASHSLTKEQVLAASKKLGALSLLEFEAQEEIAVMHEPPPGFTELLLDGLALQKSRSLSLADIDAYSVRLWASKLHDTLPWMAPWMRSSLCYREQRYADAYAHAKEAYESAQYCAGAHQAHLVSQFIDLAAKNDKWKEFRKAVNWAEYLDIKVKPLNTTASDNEGLRKLFDGLKGFHCANW